jgi:hypothetical protein
VPKVDHAQVGRLTMALPWPSLFRVRMRCLNQTQDAQFTDAAPSSDLPPA